MISRTWIVTQKEKNSKFENSQISYKAMHNADRDRDRQTRESGEYVTKHTTRREVCGFSPLIVVISGVELWLMDFEFLLYILWS